MWHAVRAFFEEGGKRLYVSRVFTPADEIDPWSRASRAATCRRSPSTARGVRALPRRAGRRARHLHASRSGQNVLVDTTATRQPGVRSLVDRDVVWIRPVGGAGGLAGVAERLLPGAARREQRDLELLVDRRRPRDRRRRSCRSSLPGAIEMRVVTVTVTVDAARPATADPVHRAPTCRSTRTTSAPAAPDSLFDYFARTSRRACRATRTSSPIVVRATWSIEIGELRQRRRRAERLLRCGPGSGSPPTGVAGRARGRLSSRPRRHAACRS